jgi:hypothetical protein
MDGGNRQGLSVNAAISNAIGTTDFHAYAKQALGNCPFLTKLTDVIQVLNGIYSEVSERDIHGRSEVPVLREGECSTAEVSALPTSRAFSSATFLLAGWLAAGWLAGCLG